jgi:hypothetical protein
MLLKSSTTRDDVATVNFSVPDKVKEQFNRTFARENKSSIIARLMMQAVEERRLQKDRARAIDRLLELRRKSKPISMEEFHRARHAGRS